MSPLLVCCIAVTAALPSLAAVTASLEGDRLILRNDHVQRVFAKDGPVWRTVSFARADGADALAVTSPEFLIRLMDGMELTVDQYGATEAPQIVTEATSAEVFIRYAPRPDTSAGAPTSVTARYWLGESPYLRKQLTLLMPGDTAVDTLQVERFTTSAPCDRGGRGEPVFVGPAWFFGLEYPGSQTQHAEGLVTLSHFPGLPRREAKTGQPAITSKTAVAGVGLKGDPLELAFSDYVDTIRRPSRDFLQYNSWYDWRGNQLTVENLTATFQAFKDNLLDPYGLTMHAFVPDDGWQDGNSIWMPRANLYPEGFAALRQALEARGTRLGLWMPLNGTNLNADWGAAQGYEKSDRGRFYCLVGPKYNAAIREATRRLITQGNLAYYKHDFNTLRCNAPGHRHLPDDRHGHEANLDAELELLAYERELQPEIFLNVTSSVWLSPWWLQHADSIWMCASDFGYDKTWPQLSPREWDMSYRDADFFGVYNRQRSLVPVSAMMTHGIIHGKLCKLGGDQETLREWADMVVMYYGRGVQLKELYITPEMVPPDWWKVLGEATRWATQNAAVLANVVMVGGDPRKGEVYGYAHWKDDRGILCLRNVGLKERTLEVPFDKSVRYRGPTDLPFRGRVIYPYLGDLPTQFISGKPAPITVPGCSVMVVEMAPGQAPGFAPLTVPSLQGAAAEVRSPAEGKTELSVRVPVPDEDMRRCGLYLIAQKVSTTFSFASVTLNGQPAKTRRATGPDWLLLSLDLRSLRGKQAEVLAALPDAGKQPFSGPELSLSAWLVADRLGVAGPGGGLGRGMVSLSGAVVPSLASRQGAEGADALRRQTTELLPPTKVAARRAQRSLTDADLQSLRAAKLRIRVFDVNSEPQYQGKFILLNGQQLAPVPPNRGDLSSWQEVILDLSPEQLKLLKRANTVELTNAGGDCYKFSGLALAVQLGDGTWAQSSSHDEVHSSVQAWAYAEGKAFQGQRSGAITLTFP